VRLGLDQRDGQRAGCGDEFECHDDLTTWVSEPMFEHEPGA
jgi:hypothetical protein